MVVDIPKKTGKRKEREESEDPEDAEYVGARAVTDWEKEEKKYRERVEGDLLELRGGMCWVHTKLHTLTRMMDELVEAAKKIQETVDKLAEEEVEPSAVAESVPTTITEDSEMVQVADKEVEKKDQDETMKE